MVNCHNYFVHACGVLASDPVCWPFLHLAFLHLAVLVMSISVLQSTTERVNSILKLIAGDRCHYLADCTIKYELVVRLLGPRVQDAADVIHIAVLKWASAKQRRIACHARGITAEEAFGDSASNSRSSRSDESDEFDTSSSATMQSSPCGTDNSSGGSGGATCFVASSSNSEDERAMQAHHLMGLGHPWGFRYP